MLHSSPQVEIHSNNKQATQSTSIPVDWTKCGLGSGFTINIHAFCKTHLKTSCQLLIFSQQMHLICLNFLLFICISVFCISLNRENWYGYFVAQIQFVNIAIKKVPYNTCRQRWQAYFWSLWISLSFDTHWQVVDRWVCHHFQLLSQTSSTRV